MSTRPTIQWLIHTVSSKRCMYGNVRCFSIITSTLTGKSVAVDCCQGNARGVLNEAVGCIWDICHQTEENYIPIREWERMAKRVSPRYQGSVTSKEIKALARKTRKAS